MNSGLGSVMDCPDMLISCRSIEEDHVFGAQREQHIVKGLKNHLESKLKTFHLSLFRQKQVDKSTSFC